MAARLLKWRMMEKRVATAGSRAVVLTALLASAGLAVAKLGIVQHSGTSAMLSSTHHSMVDVFCLALLMHGLKAGSSAPASGPDADRQLYFWGYVCAILIYGMAAGIAMFEGTDRLAKPSQVNAAMRETALLALGMALWLGCGWYAMQKLRAAPAAGLPLAAVARRPANAALLAVLIVAAGGVAGHAAALLGWLGGAQGYRQADAFASLAIGLVLAAVAAAMALEVRRVLGAGQPVMAPEIKSMSRLPATASNAEVSGAASAGGSEAAPAAAAVPAKGQKPQVIARHQGKKGRGRPRR